MKSAIAAAVSHAVDVVACQPDIDFDDLMVHIESNFPGLPDTYMDYIEQAIADKFYGGVVPKIYTLEWVPPQ